MTSSPERADMPSGERGVASYGELVMIRTSRAALTAYAAGDAFGVAYEFLDRRPTVDTQVLADLPDWPHGGVSDDTLLTLLTIGAISDDGPAASAAAFLAALLRAEAAHLPEVPTAVSQMLVDLDATAAPGEPGGWHAPDGGVSLSPVETLAAVVTVAAGSSTCLEAYRQACELGGDTDTVSALSAAPVATRDPQGCGLTSVPWLDEVRWDEIPQLPQAVSRLATLRATGRVS
jgi:hypothetical protein